MFGIKSAIKRKIREITYLESTSKFPERPSNFFQRKINLWKVEYLLKQNKRSPILDNIFIYPGKSAVEVWKSLVTYSPNNLGNWSISKTSFPIVTAKIEHDLISTLKNLYHAPKKTIEGYSTSGATEGNIFSCWAGRKYFENIGFKKSEIGLIKTSLTHYSVEKSADITGVDTYITPLNTLTWEMEEVVLDSTVRKLVKRGIKAFLIPMTLGYTLTGTSDNYLKIIETVRKLKKEIGKIDFFLWIDAAQLGLVKPFTQVEFKPFEYPEIQTFILDFHKTGFTPISSGVILYRSALRKLIEKPIDYLNQKDNTVIGSRNGISPVASLSEIQARGRSGFRKYIHKSLKIKKIFIEKIKEKFSETVKVISDDQSLSCGLILGSKIGGPNIKSLESYFGLKFRKFNILTTNGFKKFLIAKVSFLDLGIEKLINDY